MKAAKIDANQPEIVKALRKCGISVHSTAAIGKGFPDLVCAKGDKAWLIEVKGPKGKLTDDQVEFMSAWQGDVHIARSVDDALKIVGVL
jgi:Holliday junction resolvase